MKGGCAMSIDIIKESGLTGNDLSKALHLLMRSIHEKGRDRRPEDDAGVWESMFHISRAGALMGDAKCMSTLADIYYGRKVPETQQCDNAFDEAVAWWEKAAAAGDGRSATSLGLLYLHREIPGAGSHGALEYDEVKALEYFKTGYANGDMKAGRHVGLCFRDGIGTDKDPETAFEWFEKAADRGDSSAALFIADCRLKGEGCSQDIPDAIRRYEALVECNGHDVTNAAYALACIYRDGIYAPQDHARARAYFESVVKTATVREQNLKKSAEEALKELN